jgi:phosphonopyruvate decarboxylase
MIDPEVVRDALDARGVTFYSGVPCSYLKGLFAVLERRRNYVPAPNEGVALAMAAGARLTGGRAVVLAQNSGLGNLLDPLTSLLMAYDIPVLVVMSLRGWPRAEDDEPHHGVMGRATASLLDAVGVAHGVLGPSVDSLSALLDRADRAAEHGRGFVVLVPKGTIGTCPPGEPALAGALDRREAVAAIAPHLGDALVYTTTGMITREVFGVADSPRNFYMQGSMGHAVGLGLGTALSRPDTRVVVIDGDGSSLMHLGGMALVGERRPANLLHVVLDNGTYDSTGGQRTRATPIDWARLATAVGYRTGEVCRTADEVTSCLRDAAERAGPHLVAVRIAPGGGNVPRVTARFTNQEVRARFESAASAPAPVGTGVPS